MANEDAVPSACATPLARMNNSSTPIKRSVVETASCNKIIDTPRSAPYGGTRGISESEHRTPRASCYCSSAATVVVGIQAPATGRHKGPGSGILRLSGC